MPPVVEMSAAITRSYINSSKKSATAGGDAVTSARSKRGRPASADKKSTPATSAALKKLAIAAVANKNKKNPYIIPGINRGDDLVLDPVDKVLDHTGGGQAFWMPAPKLIQQSDDYPGLEVGNGSVGNPFRHIIRETPNASDCLYCPDSTCDCSEIEILLKKTYAELTLKRVATQAGKRHLCAKSLEANFVARTARRLEVTAKDTFYDLGSGNGSVLFQMALITGAHCVGIELDEHNANVSKAAWAVLKPKLEKMAAARGRKLGTIEIITGDLCSYIANPKFANTANNVIWTSNLLMPRSVTHLMSTRFQQCPPGVRIGCFDDLYPHSRDSTKNMYPELFKLFKMEDYKWPVGAVEWCVNEGPWYIHRRTSYVLSAAEDLEDKELAAQSASAKKQKKK